MAEQIGNALDHPRIQHKDTKGNEVHLSSLPKPSNPAPSLFICVQTTRQHMAGLFSGLVLQNAGLSTGPKESRFCELDSGEGLQGEALEVVREEIGHLDNPATEAQLVSKANELALSCGKITISWQRDNETHVTQLSGFWVDHRGKYFITAKHFINPMFKSLDVDDGLDQKMRAFRDEGESYVGSTLSEDGRTLSSIPVKLKSWEDTSDTAIFMPTRDDAIIRYCAKLDNIGYLTLGQQSTPGRQQRVFTVGYCGKDQHLSFQELSEKMSTAGVEQAKISYVYDNLPANPRSQFSLFHFMKQYYTDQLKTYPFSGQNRDKAAYLEQTPIKFTDIFVPNKRAVAAGRIGMWDTRGMPPPQPTDSTYSFSQLTDISLYPGLSGAAIIGIVGGRCQILAKVYGGRPNALLNDVIAFKEVYRAKIEELMSECGGRTNCHGGPL